MAKEAENLRLSVFYLWKMHGIFIETAVRVVKVCSVGFSVNHVS